MRNLFYLIERFHLIILLLILEGVSLVLIKNQNQYQNSIISNASSSVSGKIYSTRKNITEFFNLKNENKRLANENALLLSELKHNFVYPQDSSLPNESDSLIFDYIVSKVVDNQLTNSVNYLMINKGGMNGVEKGQGVITGNGVVGIVTSISNNYATVMSVISTKSRISVKHKNSGALGNLTWDGINPWVLNIDNVSKSNIVAVGDTFTTAGFSNFFPPNIPVAIVTEVEQDPSTSFLYIDVKLSEELDKLDYVYVVKSEDKPQIDSLHHLIRANIP